MLGQQNLRNLAEGVAMDSESRRSEVDIVASGRGNIRYFRSHSVYVDKLLDCSPLVKEFLCCSCDDSPFRALVYRKESISGKAAGYAANRCSDIFQIVVSSGDNDLLSGG